MRHFGGRTLRQRGVAGFPGARPFPLELRNPAALPEPMPRSMYAPYAYGVLLLVLFAFVLRRLRKGRRKQR